MAVEWSINCGEVLLPADLSVEDVRDHGCFHIKGFCYRLIIRGLKGPQNTGGRGDVSLDPLDQCPTLVGSDRTGTDMSVDAVAHLLEARVEFWSEDLRLNLMEALGRCIR